MHKLVYNFLHYKLNKPTLTFEMVFRHFTFSRIEFASDVAADANSICCLVAVVVKPVLVLAVFVSMFSHFVANTGVYISHCRLSHTRSWRTHFDRSPISFFITVFALVVVCRCAVFL